MNALIAKTNALRVGLLSVIFALVVQPRVGASQTIDHSQMQMPAEKPASAQDPERRRSADPPAEPNSSGTNIPASAIAPAMQHGSRSAEPTSVPQAKAIDHSAMGHATGTTSTETPQSQDTLITNHAAMEHDPATMPTEPLTPIPELTDADRTAAFPPVDGHTLHDNTIQYFVLLDRLDTWDADPGTGVEWEGQAWVGTDLNRLWLRSEGERIDGRIERADLQVLYGRSVARWWDVVAGIRHDFKPGASQDFAAFGIVGLAPYKFEVEATAYVGQSGQTAVRFEAAYETLLTNRLILQPLIEVNAYGQDDARRSIGSGLSTVEAGLRLRYEFTRKFAPYVGVVRGRAFGRTADFRRADGERIDETRIVAGLRMWF
ncbi:copper resistance protein B [Tahibacter aquaticus]|uniref:Copper resistance protein B n=1 Tax=Tahibacter aquaticus TaxID=520092 RepID=A0A4V3DL90_9GAMM|nr:copper resistance protein B [Tahibacter aquaticus]TDR38356.1 copper resistance protein B [Tahibacter aquaticus]